MEPYFDQFAAFFIGGIPKLLSALIIFVLSLYFARLISRLLQRVLQRRRAPAGVVQLLGQLALWSIIVAGIITSLQQFFEVTAFLTNLATERNVAASTQNQALAALLFLYKEVLAMPLP